MSIKLRNVQSLEDVAGLVGACAITVLAVIIVTALYVGREIFVPMALAILLSFVLAAPVNLLQSLRVPRALAAVITVLLAFVVIFALGSLIATQLTRLAAICRSTNRRFSRRSHRYVASAVVPRRWNALKECSRISARS